MITLSSKVRALGIALVFGVTTQTAIANPLTEQVQPKAVSNQSLGSIQAILGNFTEGERLDRLVAQIKKDGQWLSVSSEGKISTLHVSSYLLEAGFDSEAVALLDMGMIDGFVTFEFGAQFFTDFQYAMAGGDTAYLAALLKKYPEKVNEQLVVGGNGEKSTLLGLLATKLYAELPQYEAMIHVVLDAGADLSVGAVSDIPADVVASTVNNIEFIRILRGRAVQAPVVEEGKTYFSNPMLTKVELIEEQAMIDAFIEVSMEDKGEFKLSALHGEWINMIMRGYNNMAETFFDEMKKREDFDIDMVSGRGVAGLQAAALSNVYGGNVSYAQKLVSRGADVSQVKTLGSGEGALRANLIELSLPGDNYQVVAFFIQAGVPYLHNIDDREHLIIQQAIRHKSYKSASVIKGAVDALIASKVKNK